MILLDEPVSYLDIRHKLEFLSTLQRLTREWGCQWLCPCMNWIWREEFLSELFGIKAGSLDVEAKALLLACGRVIICRERFGAWEQENQRLYEYARKFQVWEDTAEA